jgi:hypothetical protein
MTDRILTSAWWLAVMTMICGAGGATLYIGYRGLFELLAQRWQSGGVSIVVAVFCASAAIQLCRHRADLLT